MGQLDRNRNPTLWSHGNAPHVDGDNARPPLTPGRAQRLRGIMICYLHRALWSPRRGIMSPGRPLYGNRVNVVRSLASSAYT
ncbi:hypothetical protein EVAR_15728_1 [Eumeta japonica]|uniref:Uncharacterized protein n=1 Tax=Eumeta variegata TaxID=151549 RepID=A0A4C1U9E1_EUMVA|nr:hypothetical protein EVAR_15728_1 [Eumeta japonica]